MSKEGGNWIGLGAAMLAAMVAYGIWGVKYEDAIKTFLKWVVIVGIVGGLLYLAIMYSLQTIAVIVVVAFLFVAFKLTTSGRPY